VFDLDVTWGKGKEMLSLRLVGYAHRATAIRWYLTTVPRSMLTARQVIQGYRELKREAMPGGTLRTEPSFGLTGSSQSKKARQKLRYQRRRRKIILSGN